MTDLAHRVKDALAIYENNPNHRHKLCEISPDMARALLAAEELADACEEVFDGIDAVGTRRFYIALAAFRKAMEQE